MRRLHLLYAPRGLLKPTRRWLETHKQLRREVRAAKRERRTQKNTAQLSLGGISG